MRPVLVAACVVLLANPLSGCGSRPPPSVLDPVASTASGARIVRLVAATNRRLDPETAAFGASRTYAMSYQAIDVSIPASHAPGQIEWPEAGQAEASKTFLARARVDLDEARLRAALRQQAGTSGDVLVFVHGYNTLHHEAVFRMAQIVADSDFRGAGVLFSWPSDGSVTGYLRDRESAVFSRDQFERFLRFVAATPGVRKIHLLAHSMGNWLTVETLRQAKIRGDMELGGKLGEVVLASPDIDSQVFQSQIDLIGKRNPPIVVFVSRNDRALELSRRLAGDVPRVGAVALDDPKVLAGIERGGLKVIDLTDVDSPDPLNHGKFAAVPAIVRSIGRQLRGTIESGERPGAGVFAIDAAGAVLDAPGRLLRTVSGR